MPKADATQQPSEAAIGPRPTLPTEAGSLAAAAPDDTPGEAIGRKTLSTAFVRIGADGLLTVKLKDGRVLLLRHVTMGPKKFCGQPVSSSAGDQFCGRYGDVAAAKAGDAPMSD